MAGLRALLISATAIFLAVLFRSSPYIMTTSSPSGSKPWADGPLALIPTPLHTTEKTDLFTTGASHMAMLHNAIHRGYNSIYHQAVHVRDADKADFIGYCLTWHKFVVSHHDDEENVLFSQMEELLGDKEIWGKTHQEHEAFLPGLAEFHKYLSTLASPADFSGADLLKIMTGFQEPFEEHFRSEISTIADLAAHPNAPKSGTPEADKAAATFSAWGKKTVMKAGISDVVPFFLVNLDASYEGGRWANWPPIPPPIKWSLVNLVGSWYGGRWRFASCDGAGNRRELSALE
ncbi:hypothetical protein RB594_007230 [Gaeumannomyces avenae]